MTPWSSGSFSLSSTTINDLVTKSSTTDFAVFVFQPDDLTESRGKQEHVVRDNVLFELGLFIGAIGLKRCFIVKPRGEELKLPSDLLGITLAEYDSQRSDHNVDAALFPACHKMDTAMKSQGCLNRIALSVNEKAIVNPYDYKLNETTVKILAACVETHTKYTSGLSSYQIGRAVSSTDERLISIQLIKLERMSLIERKLQVEFHNNDEHEYYAYTITNAGIDKLLEYEDVLFMHKAKIKSDLPSLDLDLPGDVPF